MNSSRAGPVVAKFINMHKDGSAHDSQFCSLYQYSNYTAVELTHVGPQVKCISHIWRG